MPRNASISVRTLLMRNFRIASFLPALALSLALMAVSVVQQVRSETGKNASGLENTAATVASNAQNVSSLLIKLPQLNGSTGSDSRNSLLSLLQNSLASDYLFDASQYPVYRQILTAINNTYMNHDYINGVYLVTCQGKVFSFSSLVSVPGEKFRPMDEYLREGAAYYVLDAPLANVYGRATTTRSLLTLAMPVYARGERVAVALLDMNEKFFASLAGLPTDENALVCAVSSEGRVWYENRESGASALWDGARERVSRGEAGAYYDFAAQRIVSWRRVSMWGGFTLLYAAPASLWRIGGASLAVSLVVLMVSLALLTLLSLRFTKRIAEPVVALARRMSEDAPAPSGPRGGISELDTLYARYDEMLSTIHGHIRAEYAGQLALSRMKMQAMESQMDAHFLYNTLECIYSMAIMAGANDAALMTKSLSSMFRYVSRIAVATVRVRDEAKHLSDYLTIQRACVGEAIVCEVSFEPEIMERVMLKLILQPLAENAFKHGFANCAGGGLLRVQGRRDGDGLLFTVSDNGAGMAPEQLSELRDALAKQDALAAGIGLANIAQRLRLHYEGRASLRVESTLGEGTTVSVRLPGA